MAFDQSTRNRLARFVGDARTLLADEFARQLQNDFGLDPSTGDVAELASLARLDDSRRQTAGILRDTMEYYLAASSSEGAKARQEVLTRIVREQAFTVLNRLCAIRMAEARGLLIDSVAEGYQSKGFQLYSRLAGTALGETGDAYRCYLFSLFDELAIDLPVLFDRFSAQGRLFPRESALLALLDLINHPEIEVLWPEDESIGWVYQYFNTQEERRQMRADSPAPRNSRELAVRNQFFTPRYLVEFLTDNTLGRVWYEMTQGRTSLADSCRYLVRRPNEIFSPAGQSPPEADAMGDGFSNEELLQQVIHIPFRELKDPRDIRMLDPACGSMHFGLYAFDLFESIYQEAWELEGLDSHFVRSEGKRSLRETYGDKQTFIRNVPLLIIERNIHGIDIDPRAVQIAGLSLWLRAQRSWKEQGIRASKRPQIQRSNIVCAEPMPGDEGLLDEFLRSLQDDRLEALLRHVLHIPPDKTVRATPQMAESLCGLVRTIWQEMELSGEAGSLLRIDEALTDAVAAGRQEWEEKSPLFRVTEFGLDDEAIRTRCLKYIPDALDDFWTRAEALVLAALEAYAEQAANGGGYQRRLFAEDAARGFAFIDLERKRYDAVLMNPPFGDASKQSLRLLDEVLGRSGRDVGAAFVLDSVQRLAPHGLVGSVIPTAPWFKPAFSEWRSSLFFGAAHHLFVGAHLGGRVLDGATVAGSAIVIAHGARGRSLVIRAISASDDDANEEAIASTISENNQGRLVTGQGFFVDPARACALHGAPFAYWVSDSLRSRIAKLPSLEDAAATVKQGTATAGEPRFGRAWWEVPLNSDVWIPYTKSSEFSPYWDDISWVGKFGDGMHEVTATGRARVQGVDFFGRSGVTFPSKAVLGFNPRLQPTGSAFGHSGSVAFPDHCSTFALLGFLASRPIEYILSLFLGGLQGEPGVHPNHYEVGTIQRLPWPNFTDDELHRLDLSAQTCVKQIQALFESDETSRTFISPISAEGMSIKDSATLFAQTIASAIRSTDKSRRELDVIVGNALGFAESDLSDMETEFAGRFPPATGPWRLYFSSEWREDMAPEYAKRVLSWLVGCVVGRWHPRYNTMLTRPCRNAEDPPSSITPAMVSTRSADTAPEAQPEEQQRSVLSAAALNEAVHKQIEAIWKDDAPFIEEELITLVGVDRLSEYFDRESKFFADHITTYSRFSNGRRRAPIYWPLATPSGSYLIWLYYPRLTDQTLYICVNDLVEPRLKQVSDEATMLRRKNGRTSEDEKELERLIDLERELAEYRNELLRVARFWKPNLNDGVQITAAPLWKLFHHRPWQAKLKETWQAMEEEDYDWAHLAMSIWPERVVPKCITDRSLAIAHDLEELFWVEDGGRWRNLMEPESESGEQKRRQKTPARDRARGLIEKLADMNGDMLANAVASHLSDGDWDDQPLALLLWPERVLEECWHNPVLANKHKIQLPNRRTAAGKKRLLKQVIASGCPDLSEWFSAAFDSDEPMSRVWRELAAGNRDHQPLALLLWPDRVIDKCTSDADLAERHAVAKYFWVRHPTPEWRRRVAVTSEISDEITRRQGKPTAVSN